MNAIPKPLTVAELREPYYQALMLRSDGTPNSRWLAQIIASWMVGEGVLPNALGLSRDQFNQLLHRFYPDLVLAEDARSQRRVDFSRMLEKSDLEQLLRQFAVLENDEVEWLIGILVAACLGNDHLWQDLGLWSRTELSGFLNHNFPRLAKLNSKDMKWKKFLYKQLCEAEGLYVCRAPSCEVCKDYEQCFGAEE